MKTTVNQRLETLIKALGMTRNAFAGKLKVASTQIYNTINGRNAPSYDMLARIVKEFPTVNMKWLLIGDGSMFLSHDSSGSNSNNEGHDLLNKVRLLEEKIEQMEKTSNEELVKALRSALAVKKH